MSTTRSTTTRTTRSKKATAAAATPQLAPGLYVELLGPLGAVRLPMFKNLDVRKHGTHGTWVFGRATAVDLPNGGQTLGVDRVDATYHKGNGLDLIENLPTRAALRVVPSADAEHLVKEGEIVRRTVNTTGGLVDAPVFVFPAGKLGAADNMLRVQVTPGRTQRGDEPRWRVATVTADQLRSGPVKVTKAPVPGIGVIDVSDLGWS